LAKITAIHYNFLKLLDRILLFREVVHDNVVSNDVMITSSLRITVIILLRHFFIFLVN